MKKQILIFLLAGILCTGLAAGGCGNSGSGDTSSDAGADFNSNSAKSSMDDAAIYAASEGGFSEQASTEQAPASEELYSEDAAMDSGEAGLGEVSVKNQNQKIIYTYSYSTETKEFDSFYEKINAKTEQLGGYVESSETNGSAADGVSRYAHMTLRIPADKMDQLTSMLDKESNVTYRSRSSENVTLQYVDMDSHVKALRAEQKSLLQLMEKAEKLKDIIELQSQLTQVRYEIESYESQLRMYDNLVDYSTIHLDITEVERTTNITPVRASFFKEVSDRFSDNLYAVGQSLRSLAVWLISSLPVLVPLAAVAAAVVIMLRKKLKRRKQRRMAALNIPNDADKNE